MTKIFASVFILSLILFSCGGDSSKTETEQTQAVSQNPGGLTDFEMENGIGPIKQPITLGAINTSLAQKGSESFKTKCAACHKLDERYIGPALRYVTLRRTNAYVLNQILNPDEMVKKHPVGQKLLAEYLTPMTFMNVSKGEALALLEYLRLSAQEGKEKNIPEVPIFPEKK